MLKKMSFLFILLGLTTYCVVNGEPKSESQLKVPELIRAIENEQGNLFRGNEEEPASAGYSALRALGELGPLAKEAIPTLESHINGPDDYINFDFADVLTKIEPTKGIPYLIHFLSLSDRPSLQARAAESLGKTGAAAEPAIIPLSNLLQTPRGSNCDNENDAEVCNYQIRVANALGNIGPKAKSAVPALTALLKDSDPSTRSAAAIALGKIDPATATKVASPVMFQDLKSADSSVATYSIWALQSLARNDNRIPTILVDSLKTAAPTSRHYIVSALGEIASYDSSVIPTLIKVLTDADSEVRWSATNAFRHLGPSAKAAVPALISTLKDKETIVRNMAANALRAIGTPEAMEAVRSYDKNQKKPTK